MQHQIHGVQIGNDWYYMTESDDESSFLIQKNYGWSIKFDNFSDAEDKYNQVLKNARLALKRQ